MIGVTWYGAAAYCNWLSEQERLPKDQWCYLPNANRGYDDGMTIPADVLQRKGYACPPRRNGNTPAGAGTVTSRYYGHSIELLGKYAWYQDNSTGTPGRAGACCRTIWGCSTCWATCMNGCKTSIKHTRRGKPRQRIIDFIYMTRIC